MKRVVLCAVALACGASLVMGQAVPAELLRVRVTGDASAVCPSAEGQERAYEVKWDFMTGDETPAYNVQGWSLGVLVENTGAAAGYLRSAAAHADLLAAGPGGGPPAFNTMNFFEAADLALPVAGSPDGSARVGQFAAVTQGVVLDMMQVVNLAAPATGFGVLDLVVVLGGTGPGAIDIGLTDTAGSPPTKIVAVVGGGSIEPAEKLGVTVAVRDPDDPACQSCFYFLADDGDAAGNVLAPRPDSGVAQVVRTVYLQEVPSDPDAVPSAIQAFSLSLVIPDGIAVDGAVGAGIPTAEYFQFVVSEGCVTAGVVMEFEAPYDPGNVINALDATAVLELTISTVAGDWLGVEDPAALELTLDGCGVPPVANVVVVGGESRAICDPGAFVLVQKVAPVTQVPFVRGDANADGKFDIADPVFVIRWLFRGEDGPTCRDAADANDDNVHDASDVIYMLSYLFNVEVLGNAPAAPPAPFPGCGLDTTGGTADSCARYAPCE